jgi:hypothetical protein
VGDVDRRAVDRQLDAAEEQQVQPGGGHDDVGLELTARRQPDARLGERVDLVGDDLGGPRGDRLEQVAVGDDAEPLVPRVVAGREVGVDVVARR